MMSNGGFIMDRYDAANKTAVLVANRDPAYPFEQGYFAKLLATNFARIDAVKVPAWKKGQDLKVSATISEVQFPSNVAKPAKAAKARVTLVADRDFQFPATLVRDGSFEATIPSSILASLKPGSYTLVFEAAFGDEAPAVQTSNVIVF